MEPSTAPIRPVAIAGCLDCGETLEPGQRWRCRLCAEAARIAVQEAGGQVVRPSDVARVREQLSQT